MCSERFTSQGPFPKRSNPAPLEQSGPTIPSSAIWLGNSTSFCQKSSFLVELSHWNIHVCQPFPLDASMTTKADRATALTFPMSTERHPLYTRIQVLHPSRNNVKRAATSILMTLMMVLSIASSGCMGLAMQREVMEGMREDPSEEIVPVEPIVQTHIFGQNECIMPGTDDYNQDTDCYFNESMIMVDQTVSQMLIDFSVSFEWSAALGDILGNNTDELRFVEITLLKPNGDICWDYFTTSSIGQDALTLRSESDCTVVIGNTSGFSDGNWILQVRARGYAISAPITTLSFEDEFSVRLWVTKRCIRFPEIHEKDECTFVSDLE